jgi:Zn finger protein HypA/HybF involved in hydrogenase expression
MKKIILAKPRYQCQNCLAFWREEDLKEIERVLPTRECPACGAVCHAVDRPSPLRLTAPTTTQERFQ